jgi:NAD(P)-dependent dehydrogenase (short-subunit alcohol dehydrogenase family)
VFAAATLGSQSVERNAKETEAGKMGELMQQRVWLITGTSAGFGWELVKQLLERGQKVVATARRPEQLADLIAGYPTTALAVELDVTRQESVDAAVKAAIEHFGRIDVLVNNAGYGLAGAVEEATEAEFMPVFETNVFGLIRVTRAALPQLRKQGAGQIVNLSSIAGLIGSPGWAYYNATKFAVNGFSEGLAAELAPLGIHVMVVEPGPFRTEFLGRSGATAAARIADYDQTAGKTREYQLTQNGKQAGDPEKAAAAIIAAVESPEPPKHLLLGKLALTRFRKRLEDWKVELDRWEATTLGADYPETAATR